MQRQEHNLCAGVMHGIDQDSTAAAATAGGQHMIFTPPYQQSIQTLPHSMPTPSPTPWNLHTMPWKLASTNLGQDGVMQFRAHVNNEAQSRAALHQKRKSGMETPLPVKQFISEEKITAHFNGLHISSDYIHNNAQGNTNSMSSDETPTTSTGKCFTNLTYEDYQVTAKELEEKLRNASRFTVCDQLKRLHEQEIKSTFLPEALLNRIEKPCTALVLWQPPPLLELLHRKKENELTPTSSDSTSADSFGTTDIADADTIGDDDEFSDPDPEVEDIDDFADNNNTCRLDFNNMKADHMDQDL
ncbi:uncharacterized protein LOC118752923 isoform X1 [Rhagoletis pomonella]|uniref:uncharacterized protein LOC118752394 isoform X1 n=2 Tax=Rhagoletis pomonella TaxID=28610 RepID=UPI00177C70FF|nr:uncharacterized protein LOC118752394 isoform X1 [Rhagoletis pomonella]XP_036343663.1 uncharacterized protein LOC118752923 isoform X1 [Rhagoletis pomonella]